MALVGAETYKPPFPSPLSSLFFAFHRGGMSTTSGGWPNKRACLCAERDRPTAHNKQSAESFRLHGMGVWNGKSMSTFETLPMRLLEEISQGLDDEDLSQLCQVNTFCRAMFTRDDFWRWRAESEGIEKAKAAQSWKWNIMAAHRRIVSVNRLSGKRMKFGGDLTIIDPFKVFFTGSGNELQLEVLKHLLQPYMDYDMDCVVTYRGVSAAFITSAYWDSDMAFEISRKRVSVGIDSSSSKFIAVIPRRLIDILREENGTEFEGGVTVERVNGELRTNNGDFIILDPASCPTCKDPARLTQEEQLQCADVLCAAGGCWTFTDDSSDEDDDLSPYSAELAQVLRECNGY